MNDGTAITAKNTCRRTIFEKARLEKERVAGSSMQRAPKYVLGAPDGTGEKSGRISAKNEPWDARDAWLQSG
jgi:hypothetical protein